MLEKLKMEIERKWLLTNLPDVAGIVPVEYERCFLPSQDGEEIRVQKTGSKYTYQRKVEVSGVGRERVEDKEISETEFLKLKQTAIGSIVRTRYDVSDHIAIQVYHGTYEGLIRYEMEFPTFEEAQTHQPESWVGKEITYTRLGRDSRLLQLSREDFLRELEKYS